MTLGLNILKDSFNITTFIFGGNMKKIFTLFITLSLFITSFSALAQQKQLTPKQVEQVRSLLVEGYNLLSKYTDQEWETNFKKAAKELRKHNFHQRAEAMESMADPALKEDILSIYREKMNSMAENGIVFTSIAGFFFLGMFGSRNNEAAAGSFLLFLGFGIAGLTTWLCGLVVLGDNSPASEI